MSELHSIRAVTVTITNNSGSTETREYGPDAMVEVNEIRDSGGDPARHVITIVPTPGANFTWTERIEPAPTQE